MSEFKGTAGPWNVNAIGQHWNNPSLSHIEVTFGTDGECVCDTVYEMADANLIAAAPELLEALQEMVAIVKKNTYPQPDKPSSTWGRMEAAETVITKALGQ